MSAGSLLYVGLLAVALAMSFRTGAAYSSALRQRTGTGLFGYDRLYTRRVARRPLSLFREGIFTRGFQLVLAKQPDESLERLRPHVRSRCS